MKKSILIVLIVLLAFTAWSLLAFGKAKKEEGVQQPTEIQKAEPSPAPEDFPEVVLPKAKPARPTTEDFQNLLEKKGMTPEMWEMRKPQELEVPDMFMREPLSPDTCILGNQKDPCCYWNGAPGNPNATCWSWLGFATFIDPDDQGTGMDACPYPILPFEATHVMWQVYTMDVCTLKFIPEIREVVYFDGCPYPGDVIATGPLYEIYHEGGWFQGYLALDPSVCLYGEFFNVMVFTNSDDFYDTTYCDPIYGAQGSDMEWAPSLLFDISGRVCQSYWGPYYDYGLPYGWIDVVPSGMVSGALRIRTMGYNAGQNECPDPQETWYYKEGMPDFTQYYQGVPGPAYCGPTAGANSIWYFACVKEDFPPSWGGCEPGDEIALIEEIAALAGTDPVLGTDCDALEAAIIQVIKNHDGWWFYEETVYGPEFWYLQAELKKCEDVILLLGFWQEVETGLFQRFGGHFVTLAGIDIYNLAFAFSDPATPEGYDIYFAAWPSPSPGGIIWLPDYYVPWPEFVGQNAGPFPNDGVYNDQLPVFVEVEQSIVVSPGPFEMSGEVYGSMSYEAENNHGGVEGFGVDFGAGLEEAMYDGSLIVGTEQADLNCNYGDYYPLHTFVPLGPPLVDTFIITGAAGDYTIEQLTLNYAHSVIPGLVITKYAFGVWVPEGGTIDCEYAIEDVFVLHNTSVDDIIGLEKAFWLDLDLAPDYLDIAGFDQQHQSIWLWNPADPTKNFGMTKKPVGTPAITGWGVSQAARVYDGQYMDSLKYWMENIGWAHDNPGAPEDRSIMIASAAFDLPAGGMHIEKFLKWGFYGELPDGGTADWRHFLYNVLHQEGFYRGDVNKDGKLDVTDVIYLINYLFKNGPKPIEFVSQGNVDNAGLPQFHYVDVADVIYIIGYLFKNGPAPIDKNRFLLESPFVDPAHKDLGIHDPGLFGEPDWKDLGK